MRPGFTRPMFVAGVALLLLACGSARATLVDFNGGATDYTDNFAENHNGAATSAFTWDAMAGVQDQPGPANGGGLIASGPSLESTAVYQPSTFDLTNGQQWTISEYVVDTAGLGSGDKQLQLGFINGNNNSFNGELATTGFLTARLLGNNHVELQYKDTAAGNTGTHSVGNKALASSVQAGDWLKLTLSVLETDTSAGKFNYSFSMDDYGPTGVGSAVNVLAPQSGMVTVSGLAGMPLDAGFRVATPATFQGNINYDNFSVSSSPIPEPASAGIVASALAVLLTFRRRA